MFDLFISYKRSDADAVRVLGRALRERGLEVWLDENRVEDFTSIQRSIEEGLALSKALVAWYSLDYPQSRACQWELTRGFTAAQREGDPRRRVLLINPEASNAHIHPIELRDALYRGAPHGDGSKFEAVAESIARHVEKLSGTFGTLQSDMKLQWFGAAAGDGSNRFFGRLAELWQIHSGLWSSEFPAINTAESRPVVRLRGIGGSGKSLTAEVYAIRFGAAYPGGIFWLRAFGNDARGANTSEQRTALRDGQFISFTQALGLPASELKLEELRQKLAEALAHRGSYLWVVDDVASGMSFQEVCGWLAPSPHGRTVITTRAAAFGWAGTEVKIEELGDEDALSLLTHARKPQNAEEETEAHQIVRDLGNHALAIELAAIGVQRRGFAGFRSSLQLTSRDALDFAAELLAAQGVSLPHRDTANLNLSTTLLQSVRELSDAGRDFLALAAQLAPVPIGRQVVVQTLICADKADVAAIQDVTDLAIAAMLGQSLAREPSPGYLLVHTLVLRAIRFRAGNEERSTKLRAGAVLALDLILAEIVYGKGRVVDASQLAALVEHARAVLAGKLEQGAPMTMKEAQLLDTLYQYEFDRGNYREARRITERLLAFTIEMLGEEHPNTAAYLGYLGNVLREESDLAGSLAAHGRALAHYQMILGEIHPNTIRSVSNMAVTYYAQGDLSRARSMQEQVLDWRLKVLGMQHPDTIIAMNNLAATLSVLGETAAAQALLQRAGGESQQATTDDPLLNTSVWAETLRAQGDLAGARALQEEILARRKQTLGDEHPDTLTALNNLAVTLTDQGEVRAAREMMQRALELRTKILGPEHKLTLGTLRNLGVICLDERDYVKAREYLESALAKSLCALGRGDVETLSAAYHLALTLIRMNDSSGRVSELMNNELALLFQSDPDSLPVGLREIRERILSAIARRQHKPWWQWWWHRD